MYRIGTSGFSFPDWVGPVYPEGLPRNRMLEFYERELGFDTVELNFTYYRMPVPGTMEQLLAKTGDRFEFVVRSNKDMTHDIWQDERRKFLKDTTERFNEFREGIRPLVQAGRLGCVLIQMPSFFWPIPQNFRYVMRFPELLPDVPLVVEFRHRAWVRDTAYRMLEQTGMGYCVVDEPQLPRLMPFDPRSTSDTGYFRLHGRNMKWFTASREERYNYLYSQEELESFVEPIRSVSAQTKKTYVFFNNCHAGAAARNAEMMKRLLGVVEELTALQQSIVDGQRADGDEIAS
jgi:uncharacterized protein YecE (DUF72 family)